MRPYRLSTAFAAIVAALVMSVLPAPASAQPAPPSTSDALKKYEELGRQASEANENLLEAQTALKDRQAELERARVEAAQATQSEAQAGAAEAELRTRVDQLAAAAFRGARFNPMAALLVAENPQHFLDQMSALDLLASDNKQAMDALSATLRQSSEARQRAEQAQQHATEAADTAAKLVDEVTRRKQDLDRQIKDLRVAMNQLSSSERASLRAPVDRGTYLGPPGAANDALQAALSRRGSEYEWAAAGPNEFDCSGLTMWAYARAGIVLPHSSREQYKLGKPLPLNTLLPGDLLFYDDGTGDPARIHHVGMYVGDGKMVDAPTEGQLVDVRSTRGDGHLMGARRYAG